MELYVLEALLAWLYRAPGMAPPPVEVMVMVVMVVMVVVGQIPASETS